MTNPSYHFTKALRNTNAEKRKRKSIKSAFSLKWNDTEDALQYVIAKKNLVDIIITNNKKDFECTDIEIMTAQEFLDSL